MAQLKVKQISDFVAAVGTIHNATVGTASSTAISTALSTALSADVVAKSEAISTAVSADVVVLSSAKSYADVAEADAISSANSYADSLAVNYDAAGSATTAERNANDYTDQTIINLNLGDIITYNAGDFDAAGSATTAQSVAISTAVSADVVVLSSANSYADAKDVIVLSSAKSYADAGDSTLSTAISTEKARIDALLLDSTAALDTFAEIERFITSLDTTDISGLSAAISTGDSTALSSAKSYADSLAPNYDAAGSATTAQSIAISTAVSADVVVLSSAKSYADVAELDAISSAVSQAEAKDVVRATAASTALSTAISQEVVDRNAAIAVLDADLQAQIDNLSGVSSQEEIATFVSTTSFRTLAAYNLASHVVVFVNGLQIHEAGEGTEGWESLDGVNFTVKGLGYDLEADDHIVVSGTLA